MTREFLQSLQVGENPLPEEVVDAIMEKVTDMKLSAALDTAIERAGGRNAKAITALLDMQSLRESPDTAAAIDEALTELKRTCGYLFESPQTPPPYARGTGTQPGEPNPGPATLAGALRERFERK